MLGRITFAVTAAPSLSVIVGHVDTLALEGWHVDVVVGEPVDAALFPRASVHVLPMSRGTSPMSDTRALGRWTSLLRRLRPDVLVAANPKASVLALTAARMVGVPNRVWWVWDLRHHDRASAWRRRIQLAADRLATVTVAGSASLADALVDAGAAHRPLVLGYGAVAGVDLDVFYPAADAAPAEPRDPAANASDLPSWATTAPRPPSTPAAARPKRLPTALCAGRLAADRGLDYLTEIWPQVQSRVPDARLLIAGEIDRLEPPGAALEFLVNHPSVKFLGYTAELADTLRGVDVLLEPAACAWLPEVVLEASASAVPVVGWDVPGLRDTVDAGRTGELLTPGDTAAFVEATADLLCEPARAGAMGAAAREWVGERFERSRVEELFAELMVSLLVSETPTRAGAEPTSPTAAEPATGTAAEPVPAEVDLRSRSHSRLRRVTGLRRH